MSIGPGPPAGGHDGPVVHWVLPRPTELAPHVWAIGHDGRLKSLGRASDRLIRLCTSGRRVTTVPVAKGVPLPTHTL